ncbi:MAG: hypothetical protein B7C55_10990 [Actinomycetales bacterium mxb001]|nr:MAG: hypothetical protein B7C55_10990 [Actinomycetales bacterium mxb001]
MRDSRRPRIVLAVLVLISITMILLDLRGGASGPLGPLRALGATVIGPLERATASFVIPVRTYVQSVAGVGDKDRIIAELTAENDNLRAELDTVANDKARIADLEELLGLIDVNEYVTVPGQIIAVGPAQGFAWTVTVDAGSRDGVEPDMSVISGKGLVGRVISVSPSTATVLLLVDATSTVGGRLAGTSQIGIVSGTGRQDALQMQLLDPLAVVDVGETIVTFGSEGDRPYAPGIPIGTVKELRGTEGQLTRSAIVEPYVDVSVLDIVGIVLRAPDRPDRTPITPGSTSTQGSP